MELFIQALGSKTGAKIQYTRNNTKKRGFTVKETDIVETIHSSNQFTFLKPDFPYSQVPAGEKKMKSASNNDSNSVNPKASNLLNVYFKS